MTYGNVLDAVRDYGKPIASRLAASHLVAGAKQRKAVLAPNPMTSASWAYRLLANGRYVVEVSYGTSLNDQLLGVTVFPTDAEDEDHADALTGVAFSIAELREKLLQIDSGK